MAVLSDLAAWPAFGVGQKPAGGQYAAVAAGVTPLVASSRHCGILALCLLFCCIAAIDGQWAISAVVLQPLWRVPGFSPVPHQLRGGGQRPLGQAVAPLPHRPPAARSFLDLRAVAEGTFPPGVLIREDDRAASFQRWAQQAGITASKITLASFNGLDGVLATDNVRQGEVIISIPRQAILMASEVPEPNPFPFIAEEYWQRAHFTTRLALKLVMERQKGPASTFAPYITVLPTDYPTPFFWTTAEVDQLQYTPIAEAIAAQRVKWRALFDSLQSSSPHCAVTWEEFVWALSTVFSRSYRGEFTPLLGAGDRIVQHCLLPWVDMINSRSSTPTIINYNSFLQRLELRAGEAFARGQQVWLSYGKTNDDLLRLYGYVEHNNPGDAYCLRGALDTILAETLSVPADVVQARLADVQGVGLRPYLDSVCVTRTAPYLRSVQALRMLLVPEDKNPVLNKDNVLPGTERLVYQLLYVLANEAMAAWPTTLEEDDALLKGGLPERLHLAVEYRAEKKRVLLNFIDALTEVL